MALEHTDLLILLSMLVVSKITRVEVRLNKDCKEQFSIHICKYLADLYTAHATPLWASLYHTLLFTPSKGGVQTPSILPIAFDIEDAKKSNRKTSHQPLKLTPRFER